jgi:hypothetical protein
MRFLPFALFLLSATPNLLVAGDTCACVSVFPVGGLCSNLGHRPVFTGKEKADDYAITDLQISPVSSIGGNF